jgi:hypothetical protein
MQVMAQLKPGQELTATKTLKFYPNPASADINFELPDANVKNYSIQVYNFMGKKITEIVPTSQRINFSLDNIFRGVYVFQLRDKSGKILDSGRFQVVK